LFVDCFGLAISYGFNTYYDDLLQQGVLFIFSNQASIDSIWASHVKQVVILIFAENDFFY